MTYNWIYNTSNENSYILILIIIILIFGIINFNLLNQKNDKFYNVTNPQTTLSQPKLSQTTLSQPTLSQTTLSQTTLPKTTLSQTTLPQTTLPQTTLPKTTLSQTTLPQTTYKNITEPQLRRINRLYLTPDEIEKRKLLLGIKKLDGNQESISRNDTIDNSLNDILQSNSSLYTSILTGNKNNVNYYSTNADYATLDSLGTSMTDILGGIKGDLGYAVLDDQLGTFTNRQQTNQYAYDNTLDYRTGINSNTIDGASSLGYGSGGKYGGSNGGSNGNPIFLQKDFTGVANIFAPNIIIANPPLTEDGFPDISFKM